MGDLKYPETMPQRIYPRSECQADPIYLLQTRRWVCLNENSYSWSEEGEYLVGYDGRPVDTDYMEGSDNWEGVWETERAFFDREEAREWARCHEHRWGRGEWRTFSVSATGDLAHILAPITTYWDGKPYKAQSPKRPAEKETDQ